MGPPLVRHFARGPKGRRPLGSGKVAFWRRCRRGVCRRVSGHQFPFRGEKGGQASGAEQTIEKSAPSSGKQKVSFGQRGMVACPKWGVTARKSSSATVRQTWPTESTRLELFCGSRTPRGDAATPEKSCAWSQIVEHLGAVGIAGPVKARRRRGDQRPKPPKRKRRIGRPQIYPS